MKAREKRLGLEDEEYNNKLDARTEKKQQGWRKFLRGCC